MSSIKDINIKILRSDGKFASAKIWEVPFATPIHPPISIDLFLFFLFKLRPHVILPQNSSAKLQMVAFLEDGSVILTMTVATILMNPQIVVSRKLFHF